MNNELRAAIQLAIDTADGQKNLRDFHRTFNQTLKDMGKTTGEVKEFRDLVRDLDAGKTAMEGVDAETLQLANSFRKVRDESRAWDRLGLIPHEKIRAEIKSVQEAFDTLRRSGTLSQRELAQAGQITARRVAELEGRMRVLKGAQDEAAVSTNRLGTGMRGLAARVAGVVSAYASLQGIRSLFTSILGTGSEFERLDKQIGSLMGSIAEGQRATAWIKKFATDTPLQLDEVTKVFMRLKAYGLDPMDGTMQAVVDVSEKLGGGMERVEGIATALGQAWAKQKLQTEEILQLVERGVPVWDLLAKVTGENAAQLQDMASKGKLTRDVIKQLIDELGRSSEGAAAASMDSLAGSVSNLEDTWKGAADTVANAGLMDFAKEQIRGLTGWLTRLQKDGSLERWGQQATAALRSTTDIAKGLFDLLAGNINTIKLFVTAWAGFKAAQIASGFASLATVISGSLTAGTLTAAGAMLKLGRAIGGIAIIQSVAEILRFIGVVGDWRRATTELDATLTASQKTQLAAADAIRKFNAETGFAVRSLDEMISAQERGAAALDHSTGRWVTGAAAAAIYRSRIVGAGAESEKVAKTLSERVAPAVKTLTEEFTKLQHGGKDAAEAIEQVLAGKKVGALEDVAAMLDGLIQLQEAGIASNDEIREGLARTLEKLSGEDLRRFGIAAEVAFGQAENGAKRLELASQGALDGALRQLGLSLGQIKTGMTDAERSAIDSFRVIREEVETLGPSAKEQATAVESSFRAAMDQAKSAAAKAQLGDELKKAFDAGYLSYERYRALSGELNGTLEKSKDKADETADAVRRLNDELASAAEQGALTGDELEALGGQITAVGGMANLLGSAVDSWSASMAALSPAAKSAWEQMAFGGRGAAAAVDEVTGRLQELQETVEYVGRQSDRLFDATGLQGVFLGMRKAAAEVEMQYIGQKQALDALMKSYDSGEGDLQQFVAAAAGARRQFNLLGESDLSGLESAVDSARARLESLRDSSLSTLESLQNELDRMRGNAAAVEQRRYEAQLRDLQEQLATAQAAGDMRAVANLRESLSLAEQIYSTKQKEIRAEADAARQRDREARATPTATPSPAPAPTAAGQVIRLESDRRSVQVSTSDPSGLLEVLADAGLRTSSK